MPYLHHGFIEQTIHFKGVAMSSADELKKQKKKLDRMRWQLHLSRDLKVSNIRDFKEEYIFHPHRRWRFDFAFPDKKLAIEIDGGIWGAKGGHTTGVGYQNDRDKDEADLLMGWIVYRCTPAMVKTGRALKTIEKLLKM